jgi:hypothetical protein
MHAAAALVAEAVAYIECLHMYLVLASTASYSGCSTEREPTTERCLQEG